MTRLIDLSMPVHRNMVTFPRIAPPLLLMSETWQEFAEGIGATNYGVNWLTASYTVIQSDHVGTHCDAVKHIRGPEAPGPEGIPLDYCYSDGVVLDFRHLRYGARIMPGDIDASLDKIEYSLKERDIVLIHTGASAYNTEQRYLKDHCGMSAEATRYLISKGVRLMGIDAVTFDPPVWAMFEHRHFWEAHMVMMDEDYWHLENMMNFDQLPPHGFKLAVFPIYWVGTTAAPVRAVAILDD